MDSLLNSTNAYIDINTCKYHAEGNFLFNKSGFLQELYDYLNSTNSRFIFNSEYEIEYTVWWR